MWGWLTVSFLAIFAIVLLSVSLAWGWMQARRSARFSEKLRASFQRQESLQPALLHPEAEEEKFPQALIGEGYYKRLQTILEQTGTTWTPATFLFLTLALAGTGILMGLVVPPVGQIGRAHV